MDWDGVWVRSVGMAAYVVYFFFSFSLSPLSSPMFFFLLFYAVKTLDRLFVHEFYKKYRAVCTMILSGCTKYK